MNIRLKLATVAAFAAALPAFAQIKINDNLSVTGWTVGSYTYTGTSGNTTYTPPYAVGTTNPPTNNVSNASSDSFNVDAAYLAATITPTKNVTGTVSLYFKPSSEGGINGTSEVTLLDAYVAYAATDTLTVTAGKFLSPLGYESYYAISDNMISLANQQFLAPIPGYHEGVNLVYAPDKTTTFGLGLVDSLYGNNATSTEGDGHLERNFGAEGYIQYTGVTNLTLWLGGGYETKGGPQNPNPTFVLNSTTLTFSNPDGTPSTETGHDVYVVDFWASYQIDKTSSVAAEEIYKDGGNQLFGGAYGDKGSNWLLYYQYNFSDKLSAWACFSGEDVSSVTIAKVHYPGPSYWKLSLSPAYAITPNLTVKAQVSYTDYSKYVAKDAVFFGGQVAFKF